MLVLQGETFLNFRPIMSDFLKISQDHHLFTTLFLLIYCRWWTTSDATYKVKLIYMWSLSTLSKRISVTVLVFRLFFTLTGIKMYIHIYVYFYVGA